MKLTGPHNYVVREFKPEERDKAERLARLINTGGMWEAIAQDDANTISVVLPGRCVAGTEQYMNGFLDCFLLTEHFKER